MPGRAVANPATFIIDYLTAVKRGIVQEMNQNELKKRIKEFAHQCVKLSEALPRTYLGNHIRNQLIRCSTSAASNYRAACMAQSKADFVFKLSIVVEEVDETCFWIEFIVDEKLLDKKHVIALLDEARELTAIFVSARKTTKDRTPEFAAGAKR